ncbi:MAG TPA: hypothetical protein VGM88_24725 [Kofleriaceae bacterium]
MVRVLCVIVIALAACEDHDTKQLEALRDEVCACKDADCAETAMKKVPATAKANPKTQNLAREMIECVAKLYAAERPSTDPDDATPP